jgi:hypothetical protein
MGDQSDDHAARSLGGPTSSVMARLLRSATVAALIAVVGAALIAAVAAGRSRPAAVAPPACSPSQTQVWFGLGLGGGTAGTTYYPLEFSNISRRACTLYGYPGVSAFGSNLRQVGPAATRNQSQHALVTLGPGMTAHAILGIHDWGALCSHATAALGLKVYPPGQTRAGEIDLPLRVCASRGVLVVGPVRGGVGVPGYTTQ